MSPAEEKPPSGQSAEAAVAVRVGHEAAGHCIVKPRVNQVTLHFNPDVSLVMNNQA